MKKKIITVFGATGAQGNGVVKSLLNDNQFLVRAITRNTTSEKAQQLKEMGCEVVSADLTKPETLNKAFKDAYGTFVVTNAWEPIAHVDEYQQGKNAVDAAKKENVSHFVWSTLPNSNKISKGLLPVKHFTDKARVDELVSSAAFKYHSFVEAPMYFQNLTTILAPSPQEDGSKAWFLPMNITNNGIYNGDISELGILVLAVFNNTEKVGKGEHLAMTQGRISWNEIVETLQEQGHNVHYHQMKNEEFDKLPFPGAKEFREMLNFWEAHTYFGPNAESKITLANAIVPSRFTSFKDWAKDNFVS